MFYFIHNVIGSQILPRYGKCGHGESSFRTTEKLTVVNGGINKETTNPQLSPHFHLHNIAASAAIDHTSFFLCDKRRAKVLFFWKMFSIIVISVVTAIGLWIIIICFQYAENGIIKDIGQRKLELLLGLIKEETLVFIIDTSPGILTEVEVLDKFIQSVARSSNPTSYKFVLATVGKDGNNPE